MASRRVERILSIFESPILDEDKQAVLDKASVPTLITALELSTDERPRHILAYTLGERHDASAVDALIRALDDPSPKVRYTAADALAKIGNIDAGPALLQHFSSDPDEEDNAMIAAALGAVGYRPAVPSLIRALHYQSGMVRGCAAWALGALGEKEALADIQECLRSEEDEYAAKRMQETLECLQRGATLLEPVEPRVLKHCLCLLHVYGEPAMLQQFDYSFLGYPPARVPDEADIKARLKAGGLSQEQALGRPDPRPKKAYCLNALYPVPARVLARGYHGAAERWQAKHWGTDAEAEVALVSRVDGEYPSLLYEMTTQPKPPLKWLQVVAKQFPELSFDLSYTNPPFHSAGWIEFEAGEPCAQERVSRPDKVRKLTWQLFGFEPYLEDS